MALDAALEALPGLFVEHLKWFCHRASEAAADVARGDTAAAATRVILAALHAHAARSVKCAGLTDRTRELLLTAPWLALPALWNLDVGNKYQAMRAELAQAPDLAAELSEQLAEMMQATAELVSLVRLGGVGCASGASTGDDGSSGHGADCWHLLVRVVWAAWRCYWRRPAWRGANLGGWLLLEPGPSYNLWEQAGGVAEPGDDDDGDLEVAGASATEGIEDEHGLCVHLGERAKDVVERYRSEWLSDSDFEWLRSRGFNAVRVPFGYWVVTGPTHGDRFVGPALEHLDCAVDLAERAGFQVVLDLHGCPGGESGEAPCGRKRPGWTERDWRRDETLEVLAQVARRYAGRRCVAGMQVCNEPGLACNMPALCDWYEQAIERIRGAGISAEDVAVVLPVYWFDRLEEFVEVWLPRGNFLRYENVALDFHFYQCFGRGWEHLEHREHLQVARRHGEVLRSLPGSVVGEWSLARPPHVLATDDMERAFAEAQLEAYRMASHGWFFWTYCDQADHWDLDTCFSQGWLRPGLGEPEPPRPPPPRGRAPGQPPGCYGERMFSLLPAAAAGGRRSAEEFQDMAARAGALAVATGRPASEALAALEACGGNCDEALRQLLVATAAHRIADVAGCSIDAAVKALRAAGGDENAAAMMLLDATAHGVKRPRDE